MSKPIYPCLWFDGQAKEAALFYCSVFKNASIKAENPMVVSFELNGSKFMALNGGPQYRFNEAVSFVVECASQEEIDHYWERLGHEKGVCGWLKDRYGVSWQIVPSIISTLMQDPEKGPKAMQALMQMTKIDIEGLLNA